MHIKPPPKLQSTNLSDYHVPLMDLPEFWKCAVDNQGRPYYYHVKIRIPQWEPPIRLLPLSSDVGDGSIIPLAKCNNDMTINNVKSSPMAINVIAGDSDDDGDDASTTATDDSSEDELNEKLIHLQQSVKAKKMDLGEFLIVFSSLTRITIK